MVESREDIVRKHREGLPPEVRQAEALERISDTMSLVLLELKNIVRAMPKDTSALHAPKR